MLVYATPTDLADWLDTPAPPNATVLLRRASVLVTKACRNDVYDTTPAGLPTDDDLLEAVRDACCEQASVWNANGIDPIAGVGGLTPNLSSTGIDGATLAYSTAAIDAARTGSLDALTTSALDILRNAGLASARVVSW